MLVVPMGVALVMGAARMYPARAAQQTGTLVLSVTVLPVVELTVPGQVSLTSTQDGRQAAASLLVRTNAPWQLQLAPQQTPAGPFAAPGRVRWRVGQQPWQDVATPLTWQSQQPTGEAGQAVSVEFQYQPSLDDPAGQYSLPVSVTLSNLMP